MIDIQPSNADAINQDPHTYVGVESAVPELNLEPVLDLVPVAQVKKLSASQFLATSFAHSEYLSGYAAADPANSKVVLFFGTHGSFERQSAQLIPLHRIASIELLSDVPTTNTPIDMPSVWKVRIELKPLTKRESTLVSTFEDI